MCGVAGYLTRQANADPAALPADFVCADSTRLIAAIPPVKILLNFAGRKSALHFHRADSPMARPPDPLGHAIAP